MDPVKKSPAGISLVIVGKIPNSHRLFLTQVMGYEKPVGRGRIWISKAERDKLSTIDCEAARDLMRRYNPACRVGSEVSKVLEPDDTGRVPAKDVSVLQS